MLGTLFLFSKNGVLIGKYYLRKDKKYQNETFLWGCTGDYEMSICTSHVSPLILRSSSVPKSVQSRWGSEGSSSLVRRKNEGLTNCQQYLLRFNIFSKRVYVYSNDWCNWGACISVANDISLEKNIRKKLQIS